MKCAKIFGNVAHISAGAYALEICFTAVYDWEIITGKRRWKWTMPLYFLCKYIMFFSCLGMLLVLNIDTPINCQALYSFAQFAGNAAIGSASTLLMLRTIAIWNRSLWVTIPLGLLSAGHWGILLHGMTTVKSRFDSVARACGLDSTGDGNNLFLNLLYLYTMFIDLVVLVVSTIGLLMTPGRSSLWKLLFRDGIIFFIMAFLSNAFSAVLLLINLNPAMNLMFSVPAACITAAAASRSFIRLSTWSQADVYVHQSTSINGGGRSTHMGGGKPMPPNMSVVHFTRTKPTNTDDDLELGYNSGNTNHGSGMDLDYETKTNSRSVTFDRKAVPGVMITMDTFSHVVEQSDDQTPRSTTKRRADSTTSSLDFDSGSVSPMNTVQVLGTAISKDSGVNATHTFGDGKPSAAGRW